MRILSGGRKGVLAAVLLAAPFAALAATPAGILPLSAEISERLSGDPLPSASRRALEKSQTALTAPGLLAEDVAGLRTAAERMAPRFKTDAEFAALFKTATRDAVAAVAADRTDADRLFPAKPTKRFLDRIAKADRRLSDAVALDTAAAGESPDLRTSLRILRRLADASAALAAAFPPKPAFVLPDDNAGSTTFGQSVGVRSFEDRISAWYFVHTT
jgi:hypothetical protein